MEKTQIRNFLEHLEEAVHQAWLKDLDKTKDLKGLIKLLQKILEGNTIAEFFDYNQSDIEYFTKRFSNEVINNILRNEAFMGEKGDTFALEILACYLNIFLKFLYTDISEYLSLMESIKEIFEFRKSFYRSGNISNIHTKIPIEQANLKKMSAEYFNENLLQKPKEWVKIEIKEGDILDVCVVDKSQIQFGKTWMRGIVRKVETEYFMVKVAFDSESFDMIRRNSLDYAPIGTMTKDYEWRVNLKAGDVIDCYDRNKWYPATILSRKEDIKHDLLYVEYKVGFRLLLNSFPKWQKYTKYWSSASISKDSDNKQFFGDIENFDETIPFYSKRIQPFESMININTNISFIKDYFCLDDLIPFEVEENKNYVIARNFSFSYYYASILQKFCKNGGFEKMIDILNVRDSKVKYLNGVQTSSINSAGSKKNNFPSQDLILIVFEIISMTCENLHKEYIKKLGLSLYRNVSNYFESMNLYDLRSLKKLTIDKIMLVLEFFLFFIFPSVDKQEKIQKLILDLNYKMLKTNFLEKRIIGLKTIVEILKNYKEIINSQDDIFFEEKEKLKIFLNSLKEKKIFEEIFGLNSHSQLIKNSKDLIEIYSQYDILTEDDINTIWKVTTRGDLESKNAILKILKDIASNLTNNSKRNLLEAIYSNILQESEHSVDEIHLICELTLSLDKSSIEVDSNNFTNRISPIYKCFDYLLSSLYSCNEDEILKAEFIINKIYYLIISISKEHNNDICSTIIETCLSNLEKGQHTNHSLKILQKFIRDANENKIIYDMLIRGYRTVDVFVTNFIKFRENYVHLTAKDTFNYVKDSQSRLEFMQVLIYNKIWPDQYNIDPINFVFEILVKNSNRNVDKDEFYIWLKNLIDYVETSSDSNLITQILYKIYDLFDKDIFNEKDKNSDDYLIDHYITEKAYDTILKVFLEINKREEKIFYKKSSIDASVNFDFIILNDCKVDDLKGVRIFWLLIFHSLQQEIIKKSISMLNLLYNKQSQLAKNEAQESHHELLIEKTIEMIEDIRKKVLSQENSDSAIAKEQENLINKMEIDANNKTSESPKFSGIAYKKIKKLFFILKLLIEESEKNGTAHIKSHTALIKKKAVKLKVISNTNRCSNFTIKIFANTTIWELRELISKRTDIALDFFKLIINISKQEILEEFNGKTIMEMNLKEEDEIIVTMNTLEYSIPQVELVHDGKVIPELMNIFNEWYKKYSTHGKMSREDCANFIKAVTNTREEVTPDDHRVNYIFSANESKKEKTISREAFVSFYAEATLQPDKRYIVWENLKNMGIRNDAKKLNAPLFKYNEKKFILPRFILSNNQKFFDIINSLLEVKSKEIANEAFDFMFVICTNPKIYFDILENKISGVGQERDYLTQIVCGKNIYKLVYSLHIIESLLEDLEILEEDVDFIENKESFITEELNDDDFKNKKTQWLKTFVNGESFKFISEGLLNQIQKNISIENKIEKYFDRLVLKYYIRIVKIVVHALFANYSIHIQNASEERTPETEAYYDVDKLSKSKNKSATSLIILESLAAKILRNIEIIKYSSLVCNLLNEFLECKQNKLENDLPTQEEKEDIINNSFDILTSCLIPNSKENEWPLVVENLLEKNYDRICLLGLTHRNKIVRKLFLNSLHTMFLMCDSSRKVTILEYLTNFFLKILTHNYGNITAINHVSLKDSLIFSKEVFEFYVTIFEFIFTKNISTSEQAKFEQKEILEFLQNIALIIKADINNENDINLGKNIFIGFIKILSKVCELNPDFKRLLVNEELDMITEISNKVVFQNSSSSVLNKIKKLDADFINPDIINDEKETRNKDEEVRSECFNFILSLLNDSVENFEKFLKMNLGLELYNDSEKEESLSFQNKTASSTGNSPRDSPRRGLQQQQQKQKKESQFKPLYMPSNNIKTEGYVGLRNLGCICYMNSILQQLYMVPNLRHSILQVSDGRASNFDNPYDIDDNFFHQLQKMFSYLSMSNREDFIPYGFCYAFKDWEGNPTNLSVQQDVQEFICRLFDNLDSSLRNTKFKYLVESIFGGKTCSQIVCPCGSSKLHYDQILQISVEVNNMKNIQESMDKFISPEIIDGYQCQACGKKETITKRSLLAELPNVLIVHFQRMYFDLETMVNQKINSRFEFPKILNLKNYTIEDLFNKNRNASYFQAYAEDEFYYRTDEYYEYCLTGVVVHIGSADAGHYYSIINTNSSGDGSFAADLERNENWLRFNDSKISKFNLEKMEEESFGGKFILNKESGMYAANSTTMDSIQSAYLVIYERKLKSPIKMLITTDETNYIDVNNVIKIENLNLHRKTYDLMYEFDKTSLLSLYKQLFENKQIFYDTTKNEYFYYKQYYDIEKLIPKQYFIEIIEDNSKLVQVQNIYDEQYSNFLAKLVLTLADTIVSSSEIIQGEIGGSKEARKEDFIYLFMNFSMNLLTKTLSKNVSNLSSTNQLLTKNFLIIIKEKFIQIMTLVPYSLPIIIEYYADNIKTFFDSIFSDNEEVSTIQCEIFYEALYQAYKRDSTKFFRSAYKTGETPRDDMYEDLIKVIDFLICIFPKLPGKYVAKAGPVLKLIKRIGLISDRLLEFFALNGIIFIFVTYLLGRDSPCYLETYNFPPKIDNWDVGRPSPQNCDDIIELIITIYKKSELYNKKFINSQNANIAAGTVSLKLSERDRRCLKHPNFLRYVYNNNLSLFSEMVACLSFNDFKYTKLSCVEITKIIDDINTNPHYIADVNKNKSQLSKLFESIHSLLKLNDEFQMTRLNYIIGIPQILIEEPNSRSNMPYFGFHNMTEFNSKVYEIKSLANYKDTCCLIKKIYSLKYKDSATIEIFLKFLEACTDNHFLLKYIRPMPCEEPYYDDFIQWGVTLINYYTSKNEDQTYINKLKSIVEVLNPILPIVVNNSNILPNFKGFVGKYLHNNIKREEFSLVYKNETVHIIQINYYTNTLQYSKELDYTKSRSYYNSKNEENVENIVDSENNLASSDTEIVVDMIDKSNSEKEWLRKIIHILSSGKKVVVQNKNKVENAKFDFIRFVVYNNSSKEAYLDFSIKRNSCSFPINEFIPEIPISHTILSFTIKTIFSISKINPNNKWSFESDSGLGLDFEQTKVDFGEISFSSNFSGFQTLNMNKSLWNSEGNQVTSQQISENAEMNKVGMDKKFQMGSSFNKLNEAIKSNENE